MEKEILDEIKNELNNTECSVESTTTELIPIDNIDEILETDIKNQNESISEKIELEDSNTSNCLALTIKKEYKLVAIKNVFLHSLKVTWKVIVGTLTLHLFKFFL